MQNSTSTLSKYLSWYAVLFYCIIGVSVLYSIQSMLEEDVFSYTIALPAYIIIPGSLLLISIMLLLKYRIQELPFKKTFVLLSVSFVCFFIAEQLWNYYEHILQTDPFPSPADYFYLSGPIFMCAALILYLKSSKKHIPKNIIILSIILSLGILIPPLYATYNFTQEDTLAETSVSMIYPFVDAVLLCPAIVSIMIMFGGERNYFWILLLVGIIIFVAADIIFLYAIMDDTYFDGHPVDILWLISYIIWAFTFYRLIKQNDIEKLSMQFSSKGTQELENINTVYQFRIPLTIGIISVIVILIFLSIVQFTTNSYNTNLFTIFYVVFGILGVSSFIVIYINQYLSKILKLRISEVERKNIELLKAERFSTIGELSARISHDLRNPLAVLKGSVDLLKNENNDQKTQDRISIMDESIERMSHQVDDVMGFVRNKQAVKDLEVVEEIIGKAIQSIIVPDEIKIKLPSTSTFVNCDYKILESVFVNIFLNAIDAMDKNGIISVKIIEKDDQVVIECSNSGPEIPAEELLKIFDPLFTTKQTGTGLGLASCKYNIELHGGIISVKNNPVTFIISLPK